MTTELSLPLATPLYDDGVEYLVTGFTGAPQIRGWNYNGWQAESLSWKTNCYIHAGLSGGQSGHTRIKGPGAKAYLQKLVINSLENFPVGTMKHAVACREDGMIFTHGIIERIADDEFHAFAGGPPLHPVNVPDDVVIEPLNIYLFQIAGPNSLAVLEKVTGESLKDIGFLTFRNTQINGVKTEIARIGMSGNLAFELHGPIEDGPAIYEAVYQAGKEFGIERLGWRTYLVNHVEGGFPQQTWSFTGAPYVESLEVFAGMSQAYLVSGSVDPADWRARFRTPVEVRWHNMARFDHDFIGRAALEAEIANPKRTTVILKWHPEDVMAIYGSLMQDGEPYRQLDMPYSPNVWPQAHADHVLRDGKQIGYSSGTIYSLHFREFLSMGCIDIDASALGTEVVVQWGHHGNRIKDVRATVERFPYLTEGRNDAVKLGETAS